KPAPAIGLLSQSVYAGFRDPVVLRLSIAFRSLPGALDPTFLLQPDERGIQRALIERERWLGDLLQACGEAIGVLWPHRVQGAQYDQVKRPLQQLHAIIRFTCHSSGLNHGASLDCTCLSSEASVGSAQRRVDLRSNLAHIL